MSDILDTLPVSEESVPAQDYAKLHPYLQKTANVCTGLNKHYIVLAILFVLLSLPIVDKTLEKLKVQWYIILVLKTALFIFLYYILTTRVLK